MKENVTIRAVGGRSSITLNRVPFGRHKVGGSQRQSTWFLLDPGLVSPHPRNMQESPKSRIFITRGRLGGSMLPAFQARPGWTNLLRNYT